MNLSNIEKLSKMALDRGSPYKVLIIDDERWVQEVFKDFCELTKAFVIEMVDNGTDAIEKIKTNTYDIITLDLIMPEMSGLEILTAIKKVSPHVPVMIITGNATDKIVTEAGVMGACRVMYKPIMLETFISELTSTLA